MNKQAAQELIEARLFEIYEDREIPEDWRGYGLTAEECVEWLECILYKDYSLSVVYMHATDRWEPCLR